MNDNLTQLSAILNHALAGKGFLFAKIGYADELTLHFGNPVEYSTPRFGTKIRGSHIISCRSSTCLKIKTVEAKWTEPLSAAMIIRVDKAAIESGAVAGNNTYIIAIVPYIADKSIGINLLLSDHSSLSIIPEKTLSGQIDQEDFQESADCEVLTPDEQIRIGPGNEWHLVPDNKIQRFTVYMPRKVNISGTSVSLASTRGVSVIANAGQFLLSRNGR